jgi:hypothetical protein
MSLDYAYITIPRTRLNTIMDDANRRNTFKILAALIGTSFLPSCSLISGRNSNCKNYQFDQIEKPIIDMHAHFFNATDLMVVEYIMGPALNDMIGDRYQFLRAVLIRVANAILRLEKLKRHHIKASSELRWLQSGKACNPNDEYAIVSEEFFELITEEERNKSFSLTGFPINLPFNVLLNKAATEFTSIIDKDLQEKSFAPPIIQFDKKTLLRAVAQREPYQQKNSIREDLSECPSDPSALIRILAFAARALVMRSTNIQAYYDKYSLAPIDGYGVKHVMNISCDFDFFLGCPNYESSIKDQIKVHEEIWRHTKGYAIPILGVNPWKIYHDDNYAELIDKTLERGIFKGVKLYPSIGYSVTGKIRKGVVNRTCNGLAVSEAIVKEGMDKLFSIVDHRKAYITSHTTYSKGAEHGSESLASSKFWIDRLRERPDLKVNFGHMGAPSENVGNEWRTGFLSLMSNYENVYADFGYHEYDNYENVKNDLETFKHNHGQGIFKKIAYGSDWYMISKDDGANAYLCTAIQNFEQAVSENVIKEDQMKDMFYNNSARFLNISNDYL